MTGNQVPPLSKQRIPPAPAAGRFLTRDGRGRRARLWQRERPRGALAARCWGVRTLWQQALNDPRPGGTADEGFNRLEHKYQSIVDDVAPPG